MTETKCDICGKKENRVIRPYDMAAITLYGYERRENIEKRRFNICDDCARAMVNYCHAWATINGLDSRFKIWIREEDLGE